MHPNEYSTEIRETKPARRQQLEAAAKAKASRKATGDRLLALGHATPANPGSLQAPGTSGTILQPLRLVAVSACLPAKLRIQPALHGHHQNWLTNWPLHTHRSRSAAPGLSYISITL